MEKTNQDLKNFLILGGAMAFSLFFILTQWHFSSRIMTAQIVQPDNQEKIDEDNWYDDYGWSVYAKAKDWAEVNSGELCHEM